MKTILIFAMLLLLTSCQNSQNKDVIVYGSSTLSYIAPFLKQELLKKDIQFINDAQSGQLIETMSAHQGANPVSISIIEQENDFIYEIKIKQDRVIGKLSPWGVYRVKINNEYYGSLDLNKKKLILEKKSNNLKFNHFYKVEFGFEKYSKKTIHLFCIGKNNLVIGGYSAEQVFNEIKKMVEFIESKGNKKYLVCGNFVDKDLKASIQILKLNEMLKKTYKEKYFDMQAVIQSERIWNEVGILPTKEDILSKSTGGLPPSLARNKNHLNDSMDKYFAQKLFQKMKELNYF